MHLEISRILPSSATADGASRSFTKTNGSAPTSDTEAGEKSFLDTFQAEASRANIKASDEKTGRDQSTATPAGSAPEADADSATNESQPDPDSPPALDGERKASPSPSRGNDDASGQGIETVASKAAKTKPLAENPAMPESVSIDAPAGKVEAPLLNQVPKQFSGTGGGPPERTASQTLPADTAPKPLRVTAAAPSVEGTLSATSTPKAEPTNVATSQAPTAVPGSTLTEPREAKSTLAGGKSDAQTAKTISPSDENKGWISRSKSPAETLPSASKPTDASDGSGTDSSQRSPRTSMSLSETVFGMRTSEAGSQLGSTTAQNPVRDTRGEPRAFAIPDKVLAAITTRSPSTTEGAAATQAFATAPTPEGSGPKTQSFGLTGREAEGVAGRVPVKTMPLSLQTAPVRAPAGSTVVPPEPATGRAASVLRNSVEVPDGPTSELRAEIRQVTKAPIDTSQELQATEKKPGQSPSPRADIKGDAHPPQTIQSSTAGTVAPAPSATAATPPIQTPIPVAAAKSINSPIAEDPSSPHAENDPSKPVTPEIAKTRSQFGLGHGSPSSATALPSDLTATAVPSPPTGPNKFDSFEDLTLGGSASVTDGTSARSEIAAATGQRPHPSAQAILAQLQAALPKASGEATEILLNPEELGRVRMTLSGSDGVGSVLLQVERPETLDLIRRNIEQMRAELAEAGWDSVTFNFAQSGSGSSEGSNHQDRSPDAQGTAALSDAAPEATPPASRANASASGLDLRL